MTTEKLCKECGAPDARWPGPRCYSHHARRKRAMAAQSHRRHVQRAYDLADGEYDRLLVAQGGRCAICLRRPPRNRRLAVDHDHDTGEVRGLLCTDCNRILLGRWSLAALRRAIAYLTNPPTRDILTPEAEQC
ncbi:endonuclease domain-containing protein [Gordonia amicalis]|uniref:endonuclease domain-containing protein n=1 Tax=Gordonia amicalis TaxID=89053 RepID=UPI002952B864|nr:endonuclease domain-containing protein [Gordonia amicalis]MDV7099702.1 endonuclease domain-containing protein [Gordonia amicalis]